MTTETIEWEDDNVGRKTSQYMSGPCYRPNYAVELSIMQYSRLLINEPVTWKDCKDVDLPIYRALNMYLGSTEPKLPMFGTSNILTKINKLVPKALTDVIGKYDITDPKISDFVFLSLLGKKKNWKEGCAICLADEIMGKACGCGHTEIVILRPCGHTMCSPCFVNLMKTKNHKIGPTTFTTKEGVTYEIHGSADVNTNFKFNCPLCTVEVTSTFRAEEVRYNEKLLDLKQLRSQIMEDMYIPYY